MTRLVRCKNDPKHSYLAVASKCPWCELIAVARLMFFVPGQGVGTTLFRPEDFRQIIPKLAGMELSFVLYTRPRAISPVRVSLRPGLRAPVRKPARRPILSRLCCPPNLRTWGRFYQHRFTRRSQS